LNTTAEEQGDLPTLDELRGRAADARARPSYGHDALIACDQLVRIFATDDVEVQALQGLDLTVTAGDLVALVGASGSGKSTLLQILAGLDVPTAGRASVAGCDLLGMGPKERLRYRREVVGFVWQQTARNLLPFLSARQNVLLPMQLRDRSVRASRRTCWRSATARTAVRRSCPAASSSGSPSPSPSPTAPRWSWPTSPPASWTRTPRT
jgi:ABC-type sugar transport system ATPase subunit